MMGCRLQLGDVTAASMPRGVHAAAEPASSASHAAPVSFMRCSSARAASASAEGMRSSAARTSGVVPSSFSAAA